MERYYDAYLNLLSNVNSVWTFKYLFWLLHEIDGNDEVSIGVVSYRAFFRYLSEHDIKHPSERTMRMVLSEMIRDKIVLRLKSNKYMINPSIISGYNPPSSVGQATEDEGNMSTDGQEALAAQDEVSVNNQDLNNQ